MACRDDGVGQDLMPGGVAAASLGVPFYDTDPEITRSFDCTVAELWDQLGEPDFGALESAVVLRLAGDSAIVATGGGAVLDPGNRGAFRYGEAADHVIETSGKHIAEAAEEIVALWAP